MDFHHWRLTLFPNPSPSKRRVETQIKTQTSRPRIVSACRLGSLGRGSGRVEYDNVPKFEFARRANLLPLRALYPPPHAKAGLKVLAVVRESRSPGSTKRVLTTSGAMAARKPLLQPSAAQPVEHGRGSGHRQETVRKLASQAGQA